MDIPKIFSFTFLLFQAIHARNNCPPQFCGSNPFPVRFPFRLESQQPRNCGYSGFDLSCSIQKSKTILSLPYSGDFWVRDINYLSQEIKLYDPNGCLPSRLLSLNLSSSPFMAAYYKNFTFLSCPSELVRNRLTTIDCLSNSTISVLATSSMNLARAMNICSTIFTLPIPVPQPVQDDEWLSSGLNGDLLLTWNVPNCEDCEARGGVCGYDSRTSEQIVCFNHPTKARGRVVLFKIALALAVPAIACSIGLLCYVCLVARRVNQRPPGDAALNMTTAAVAAAPARVAGLDESSIESYRKVVLGESRRPPGPNGVTCPICLADYHPKETVRCIPECEHCFHSDCIDEWLRMQNTCPVCRNSPSPNRTST